MKIYFIYIIYMTDFLSGRLFEGDYPTSKSFEKLKYPTFKKLKSPTFKKLKSFKAVDDIPYKCFQCEEDLITEVINRTDNNRIKIGSNKIYFVHPIHERYACDMFGSIYDIAVVDHDKLVVYGDKIFINCKCNGTIKYDYIKFKNECIKIKISDYYKKEVEYAEDDSKLDESDNDGKSDESDNDDKSDSSNSLDSSDE